MGFLDKAKAAATDLAAKADTALSSSGLGGPGTPGGGDADTYLRDLGVLAYLEVTGREAAPGERGRVLSALQEMESRGVLGRLSLRTSPPPAPGAAGHGGPPPAPGTAAHGGPPPPAPGSAPVPPSEGSRSAAGPSPAAGPAAPPTPPPPPPPPSWMTGGSGSGG
jgi:hypothetical protein